MLRKLERKEARDARASVVGACADIRRQRNMLRNLEPSRVDLSEFGTCHMTAVMTAAIFITWTCRVIVEHTV